jgi:hypothetical protein
VLLFASNPSSSSAAWEETHTILDGERVQGGTHHFLQLLQVLHLSQSVCEKGRRERSCASTLHVDLDPGSTTSTPAARAAGVEFSPRVCIYAPTKASLPWLVSLPWCLDAAIAVRLSVIRTGVPR